MGLVTTDLKLTVSKSEHMSAQGEILMDIPNSENIAIVLMKDGTEGCLMYYWLCIR